MDASSFPPGRGGNDLSGRRGWRRAGMALLGLGALATLAAGCNQGPPPAPRKPAQVVVTTPVHGDVVDYQDFTGRLDGFRTVDVRARVSGYITEAPFKEGDYVHEGELLFQIDPRPYKLALNQAEAQVQLQEAQLKYQDALYQRNLRLKNAGQAVGMEELQQSQAQRDTTAAQLENCRAAVENAKLNLAWTKVTAPMNGRVSRRSMDPGNLMTADNIATGTALTTLVSDQQLYAYFDVDERTYLNLVKPYQSGYGSSWLAKLQFPVLMSLANEGENFEHVGKVDFIDNRVNATTGTIRMRGVFDNASGLLKSGLFAHIRLPLGRPYRALLVPSETLQYDQGRTYVFVVNKVTGKDGTEQDVIAYRPITVGQELKGLRVVKEGLKEDERVVLSGQQRVRPNVPVQVEVKAPPPSPQSPLVPLLADNPPRPEKDKTDAATGKTTERQTPGTARD